VISILNGARENWPTPMDLETVLDALQEYALHEWDGHKAATANTLLQLGDNFDHLGDFMAAVSPRDIPTVKHALERYAPPTI